METKARTLREVKEEIVLKLNGKLVYTLLGLLIALVTWIGQGIVDNTHNNSKRLEEIHDSVADLQKDFDYYTKIHKFEHEELELKYGALSTVPKDRRPTTPTAPCDESSSTRKLEDYKSH
jgi:hypothetical protein